MEIKDIQIAINDLENDEFYNISNSINRVLRIAQFRKDIEELLFCRLIKVYMATENNQVVYKEVKNIAITNGLKEEEYKEIFKKIYSLLIEVRKCNWYDGQSEKILHDRIVVLPVSEIVLDLKTHEDLLENNKIPEGLAPLDVYQANINKRQMDNLLYNHINGYKTILNKTREYLIDYLLKVEHGMLDTRGKESLDIKGELELLISEGYEVSRKCLVNDRVEYIKGIEYVAWIEKCKQFITKYVSDTNVYSSFTKASARANGSGRSFFEEMMGILTALLSYDFSIPMPAMVDDKINKIFISHSSKDVEYVNQLVQLLNNIGIKKSDENIFCSSLSGYGIPYGENIYDYLKSELNKSNIMVLFVLSHNYYESAPCLNEMGAAWISSKLHNSVLTPNFDFRKITGAIDPSKISFFMNDEDGLNEFKDKIVEIFNLEDVNYKIWERDRKKFVKEIVKVAEIESETMGTQINIERVRKGNDTDIEIQLRFINVTDKDLEFKFIDIGLTDSNGNKKDLTVEESHLNDFKLFSKENKVVTWLFPNEENTYNPRRDVKSLSTVDFELY